MVADVLVSGKDWEAATIIYPLPARSRNDRRLTPRFSLLQPERRYNLQPLDRNRAEENVEEFNRTTLQFLTRHTGRIPAASAGG